MQDNTRAPEIQLPESKTSPNGDAPLRARLGPDHPKVKFLAMATLLIMSIGSGFLGGWIASDRENSQPTAIQKERVVLESQGDLISQIAETVGQSVVSISVTVEDTRRDIFGFVAPVQGEAAGTGIVLTAEGLVLTNRHVVPAETTKVSVTLADGTELDDVTIVGRTSDRDSLDIAFLKINDLKGKKLTPAKLGDSSKIKIGAPVVAIGNALGQFQNTVTSGILSGYGRSVQAAGEDGNAENLEGLFQTDAAINQGNSGGPLVNLAGEVIGVNTAVAGGGAENIGFAIPINDVTGLIDSVIKTGKLQRPYLGVVYVSVTNDLAQAYDLPVNRGAYIAPSSISGATPIMSDGPADKAGLKPGDIITKVNGVSVDQRNSLSALINKHKVGEKIKLTVLREGKEQTAEATLGAAPTAL
ncbi:MAG TPA: trypsin-like peptidase domain-containing protein [Candidatus Saccharimonadales bacterium]|nr:trypsin-like peptidase domain-containing protein [Candidatus Saccharimonadales bacterium]